jgi:hypothetical protein
MENEMFSLNVDRKFNSGLISRPEKINLAAIGGINPLFRGLIWDVHGWIPLLPPPLLISRKRSNRPVEPIVELGGPTIKIRGLNDHNICTIFVSATKLRLVKFDSWYPNESEDAEWYLTIWYTRTDGKPSRIELVQTIYTFQRHRPIVDLIFQDQLVQRDQNSYCLESFNPYCFAIGRPSNRCTYRRYYRHAYSYGLCHQ